MLNYLEDFIEVEVIRRFQPAALSTPRQGLSILAKRFELKKRVIYTVEEHLIVDVLALSVEVLWGLLLELVDRDALIGSLFLLLLLALLLPLRLSLFLEGEVELEREHLRVGFVKVLTTTNLRIL